MRKLNITEDMAEVRKQWRQPTSPLPLGVGNEDNDDILKPKYHSFTMFKYPLRPLTISTI